MSRADYGIDAPGVVRNLFLACAGGLALALALPPVLRLGPVLLAPHPMGWGIAISCGAGGAMMLLYSRAGKFRHRDRMLALHAWKGDEQVLDVGTGRGLLLVGAARRLTTGRATGLDLWSTRDLGGNARERTERNLEAEGVARKCSLVSEPAQRMSFEEGSFHVVLSNMCLHNIPDRPTRQKACLEIARVLRPGGVAILSDYKLTGEYASTLREAGLRVHREGLGAYPPVAILVARKPGAP